LKHLWRKRSIDENRTHIKDFADPFISQLILYLINLKKILDLDLYLEERITLLKLIYFQLNLIMDLKLRNKQNRK
jgi:hypothetical protein